MPACWHKKIMKIYSPFEGGFSEESLMPARLAQQEDENWGPAIG
jgi:hypothetical protein